MWKKEGNIYDLEWAQLPVVDNLEFGYRIFYSTRDEKGKSIPKWIGFDKEFKQLGLPSKPLIELGKPGTFDHFGIMPTEIKTVGKLKYLYYIGWSLRKDVPYHNSLGLAISSNGGKTWTKYSDGPIFTTSALEPGFIGTVDVKQYSKGYWEMYYLSCRQWVKVFDGIVDRMESIYDIKMATSYNGINWQPTGKVIVPLLEGEGGISAARRIGNELWYSVRGIKDFRVGGTETYKIKKSILVGDNWERVDGVEIEEEGKMAAYPYVIYEGDKLRMFYNTDFGKNGIFTATKTI